jgi:hypothetical protein
LSELLAEGGDVERLLRRTEVGSKASSKRLADVLFRRGDVESLRHRADASDTYARALLVLLLAKQGDVESLNQLVDVGDPFAAAQLAGLPGPGGGEVDRGEHLEPELVLADEPGPAQSDRGIEDRQIELLFERGDVEGLRQRAKAGNHFAYALLAVLFAELEGLRQRADAGDEFAAKSLEALADAGDEFAAKSLAAMLAERNHVEGAVRRVISASSGSRTARHEDQSLNELGIPCSGLNVMVRSDSPFDWIAEYGPELFPQGFPTHHPPGSQRGMIFRGSCACLRAGPSRGRAYAPRRRCRVGASGRGGLRRADRPGWRSDWVHSFCKLFVSPWMCGATAVAMTYNWTSGEANNARSKVVTSNTQSAPSPMWRHLADRSGYRSGLRQIRP